jgi:RHS repeat-associated protein
MPRSPADNTATSNRPRTILLATDNKNSVLAEIAGGKPNSIAYSAYGLPSAQQEIATCLGFNGELREARIGWYLLGNGYRAYNPVLMRFHSPDSWSPFGKGGLNAYMYCVGDPVNFSDPTGHINPLLKLLGAGTGTRTRHRSPPPFPPPFPPSRPTNEYVSLPGASQSTNTTPPVNHPTRTSRPIPASVARNGAAGSLPDGHTPNGTTPHSPEMRSFEEYMGGRKSPTGRSTPAPETSGSTPPRTPVEVPPNICLMTGGSVSVVPPPLPPRNPTSVTHNTPLTVRGSRGSERIALGSKNPFVRGQREQRGPR